MLPRLRFVIAAIVIAVLPMLIFSTAPFHVSYDAADAPRAGGAISLGPADMREAQQQLQVMGYARRADELSRLRELASRPLDNWVAEPAGTAATPKTAAIADSPVTTAEPPTGAIAESPARPIPDVTAVPGPVAALAPAGPTVPEPARAEPVRIEPIIEGLRRPGAEPASLIPQYFAAFARTPTAGLPVSAESPLLQLVPPLPHPRPKIRPPRRPRVVAAPAPPEPVNPFQALFGISGTSTASR